MGSVGGRAHGPSVAAAAPRSSTVYARVASSNAIKGSWASPAHFTPPPPVVLNHNPAPATHNSVATSLQSHAFGRLISRTLWISRVETILSRLASQALALLAPTTTAGRPLRYARTLAPSSTQAKLDSN